MNNYLKLPANDVYILLLRHCLRYQGLRELLVGTFDFDAHCRVAGALDVHEHVHTVRCTAIEKSSPALNANLLDAQTL